MKKINHSVIESDLSSNPRQEIKKKKGEQDGLDEKIDHRYYDQVYEEQRAKYLETKFDKRALEIFKCQCMVCQNFCLRKLPTPLKYKFAKSTTQRQALSPRQKYIDKDYVFILKRLIPPHRAPKSLSICIPDTVCFTNGEPRLILYTQKDKKHQTLQIKSVRQKEKLTFAQIRKFLNDRRKKYRDFIELFYNKTLSQMYSLDESSIIKTQSSQNVDKKYSSASKHPKIQLHSSSKPLLKNQALEQSENYEVHQDKNSKEAVLCKYDDDNTQIMNDIEFLNLMMRRKADPIWFRIQYVQNFVRPKKVHFEIQKIVFRRKNEQMCYIFKRALVDIQILNGDISHVSQDYIKPQEEEDFLQELKLDSTEKYLRYQSYKIINYIQIFYGPKLQKGVFEWMKDDSNDYYFTNAQSVKYLEGSVLHMTNEMFYKTLEDQTVKKLSISQEMNNRYQHRSKMDVCLNISKVMEDQYLTQKKSVGIDLDYFDEPIDNKSDNVFQILHPNIKSSFKEIIGKTKLYEHMRKKLLDSRKKKIYSETGYSKMFDQFFYNPQKERQIQTPQSSSQTRQEILFDKNASLDLSNAFYHSTMTRENTPNRRNIHSAVAWSPNKSSMKRKQIYSSNQKKRTDTFLIDNRSTFLSDTPMVKIKKNSLPYYLLGRLQQ